MIVQEYLNDGNLVRHYSNEGYFIRQVETNILYEDAVDVIPEFVTFCIGVDFRVVFPEITVLS